MAGITKPYAPYPESSDNDAARSSAQHSAFSASVTLTLARKRLRSRD